MCLWNLQAKSPITIQQMDVFWRLFYSLQQQKCETSKFEQMGSMSLLIWLTKIHPPSSLWSMKSWLNFSLKFKRDGFIPIRWTVPSLTNSSTTCFTNPCRWKMNENLFSRLELDIDEWIFKRLMPTWSNLIVANYRRVKHYSWHHTLYQSNKLNASSSCEVCRK